ncbi:MAG TPA: hypothetical protein VMW16_12745 [Sedimentisphaerales bacterium]|nr:hypothetical protein [Sedimentisphaerales bacterium]
MKGRKNKIKALCLAACATIFLLAGCGRTLQYQPVDQVCVPDANKANALQAAEDVLGRMHFTIDKADADQGFIRTNPLPGAQFFEFWRKDNIGPSNSLQANLHSIRRIAELQTSQQAGQLCIKCDVKLQRLSLPEHEVTSSARAYEMFAGSSAAMQELRLHPQQKKQAAWLDLDNDTELATVILKQIEEKLNAKNQK